MYSDQSKHTCVKTTLSLSRNTLIRTNCPHRLNANEVMQAEVQPEPAVRVKWDCAKKGEFAVVPPELRIKPGPNLGRAELDLCIDEVNDTMLHCMESAAKQVMSTYKRRGVANTFPCDPWYDQECKDARKLRNLVFDSADRNAQAHKHENRKYRGLLSAKKVEWKLLESEKCISLAQGEKHFGGLSGSRSMGNALSAKHSRLRTSRSW